MDKNKFALNDDVMEEVSGGEMWLVTFYDYECKNCFNVWTSSSNYSICPMCASTNIVINSQHEELVGA